jgi:signal transduction histidine kinase
VTPEKDKTQQLEYSLFVTISTIGAFATFFLFLYNLFGQRELTARFAGILAFVLFVTVLLKARHWREIRWLGKMLIIGLYLLINFTILVGGGGLNFSNTVILFLIYATGLIITGERERRILIIATFMNLGLLLVIEHFYPQLLIRREALINGSVYESIFKILFFLTGGYLISFLKSGYEKLAEELSLTSQEIIRDLPDKAGDRTEDLLKLNRELDLLFFRSSNDFRRPLTTLKGLNEVARLSKIGPEGMELMELMTDTVNQMDVMLKKFYMLYEISRFRSNGHRISLHQIVDDLQSSIHEQGHQIDCRINLIHYPDLDARNKILWIILENLIENAIQYSRGSKAEMIVEIFESNREVNINFEDNGIGIDETFFNRIFDMYFRGTELSRGNGLGLYVVKSGVEKLEGSIQLKSKQGNFTRFEISFPI